MKGWKQSDIDKLVQEGRATFAKPAPATAREKRKSSLPKIPKQSPEGVSHIKGVLIALQVPYVTELEFDIDEVRKFRFDIAIPSLKIAIEYEGLFSDKSGHTTAGGYIKDCEKYNLATVQGWRILRYTGNNYKDFIRDFNKIRNDEQH